MMLERNQAIIGLVVSALIAVGTFWAISASSGAFRPGTPMSAEFTDAAGLERDDFVMVAGVRAGRVEKVRIDGDKVVVDFRLDAPEIAADSTAEIYLTGALGRRAIRINPGGSSEVFEDGDVIPLSRTSTPIDLPELGDETVELLAEANVRALDELLSALADITEGQQQNLADVFDGVQRLASVVEDRRDDIATVLDRGLVVVDAIEDKDRELVTIIDRFGSTLSRLVERREDVTRLLTETAAASNLVADLVEDRRGQLDRVLDELARDLAIVDAHQIDLAHIFAYGGVSFEGFASIGYQLSDAKVDNPTWGNVFVTEAGAVGIDPIFGCGGDIDQALTMLIGPDPQCEEQTDPVPSASPASVRRTGLHGFFDLSRFEEVAR